MSVPLTSDRPAAAGPSASQTFGTIERVLLVLGIVLFVVLLYRIGLAAVWQNLHLIGWGFAAVFGQEILAFVFNTLGWRSAFPPPGPRVSFQTLLAGRIAGDAISNLTPTATVGGEVIRARMLDGQVESSAAWASVVIAKILQSLSQMLFILIGMLLVGRDTPLPGGVRRGLFIGLTLIAAGLAAALVLQRRGLFAAITRIAARLGVKVPDHISVHLRLLDEEIARFYSDPRQVVTSTAYFFAGWLMAVVETYLLLVFLRLNASWRLALTVEVLSTAIDAILFLVPARAGTQEGGKVLIFSVLGLDTAKGLSLGVAKRIRELAWGVVGLLILWRHQSQRPA